jgi:hypothetical protein
MNYCRMSVTELEDLETRKGSWSVRSSLRRRRRAAVAAAVRMSSHAVRVSSEMPCAYDLLLMHNMLASYPREEYATAVARDIL